MNYSQVPEEINKRVMWLARRGRIWKYAEFPDGRFKGWEDLTVGDCEQLVEAYSRRARKSIERFIRTNSQRTAKTAAEFIDRARLYRDRYNELLGKQSSECDMSFPFASVEEIKLLDNDT